jgi:hypothetical protein
MNFKIYKIKNQFHKTDKSKLGCNYITENWIRSNGGNMRQFFLLARERAISCNNTNTKFAYQKRLTNLAVEENKRQHIFWGEEDNINLYAQVYYFHRGPRDIDADNLSKPVIDSLVKVIYEDDILVLVRRAAKIDLRDSEGYSLSLTTGLPTDWSEKLLNAVDRYDDFLFIEIGELEKIPVFFGRATNE